MPPCAALELSDNVGRLTSFAPAELDYSVEDPGAIGVRAAERERRLGVTRQSLSKLWLADRSEQPR